MCPMRFLLVFFSAMLAGYFALTTARSAPHVDADGSLLDDSGAEKNPSGDKDFDFKKVIQDGFWVFVDMASGRYLWRNLRSSGEQAKSL